MDFLLTFVCISLDVIFSEVDDDDYDTGETFDLEDDSEDTEVKVYAVGNRYYFNHI